MHMSGVLLQRLRTMMLTEGRELHIDLFIKLFDKPNPGYQQHVSIYGDNRAI